MKKIIVLSLLSVVLIVSNGCTRLAGVVKALSKDPAFIDARVPTPYGMAHIVRDGRPQSGNSVSPEGMVSSTPPTTTNIIQRLDISPSIQAQIDRLNETAKTLDAAVKAQAASVANARAPQTFTRTNHPAAARRQALRGQRGTNAPPELSR